MRDIALYYQGRYLENLDRIRWPEIRILGVKNTDIESFMSRRDFYSEVVSTSYLLQMSNGVRLERIDSSADVDFSLGLIPAPAWRISCKMADNYETTMIKEIAEISLKLNRIHLLCFIPVEWENAFSKLYSEPSLFYSWTGDEISVGLGLSFQYGRMVEVPYECRIQRNGFTLQYTEDATTRE